MYYLKKTVGRWIKTRLGLRTYPPKRYAHLFQEIDALHPRTILEIGTNDGINAAHLCRRAKQYRDDIEYYGFDLFELMDAATFLQEFTLVTPSREEVDRYLGCKGILRRQLFPGNTVDTLRDRKSQLPKMDLVFIDGGHSQETVAADWNNVQDLIHDTSVVFFDDYPNFGIGAVVDAIDPKLWKVTIMPAEDVVPANPRFQAGIKTDKMRIKLARVVRA